MADPDVLVDLLRHAAAAVPLTTPATTPVFALSTKTWRLSTQLTLGKLAGVSGTVRTCPPSDVSWTAAELAPVVHLVNCHGAEFDPRWYGEARLGQQDVPPAMDARLLPGLIPRGSVVAAECCYGAAHWPPAAAGGQAGIAATQLREGASGVFGSANVSYGPAAANAYADVICQLFVSEVLAGAFLGRAALTARQRFVQGESFLDPSDLKTLGQFDLLGDPSAHPIVRPGQSGVSPAGAAGGTPADPVPHRGPGQQGSWAARRTRRDRCAPAAADRGRPRAGRQRGRLRPAGPAAHDPHPRGARRPARLRAVAGHPDPHVRGAPGDARTAQGAARSSRGGAARRVSGAGRARRLRAGRPDPRPVTRRRARRTGDRTRGEGGGAAVSGEQTVSGLVEVRRVAARSKSDQVTAVLTTEDRSWLLRRSGGPSFGVDDELAALDGQRVTATGFAGSGVFLATALELDD